MTNKIKNVYKELMRKHFESYRAEDTDYNEFVDNGETILCLRTYLISDLNDSQIMEKSAAFLKNLHNYISGDILKITTIIEYESSNKIKLQFDIDFDGELLIKSEE